MEITLYEANGTPVAYIADDGEQSIYTWDGHAVCYIFSDKIYGWKGHHIGWYSGGVIYDVHGYQVGYTKEKCPSMTRIQPIKHIKYIKYIKNIRYIPYLKPFFRNQRANISLLDFLKQDAK